MATSLVGLLPTGVAQAQAGGRDCVRFESSGRLQAGAPFRADLQLGLELRLLPERGWPAWNISVGPKGNVDLDYLWVASPPLQTAPHRVIGPAYGMTVSDSLRIERPLRFVLTESDHTAAIAAIELQSAETLRRLDLLGKGHLTLQITGHQIREHILEDGRRVDAFEWITFSVEACVPKSTAGDWTRNTGRAVPTPSA
ncbi:MAG: hypothetical protein AMXMBFR57_32150 [Acidimicrobiia bacterium]